MSRLDVYRAEEAAASTASGRDAARRDRKLPRFLGGKGDPAGGRGPVLCLTTAPRLPPPHSQPTAYCTHATQPTVPPWTVGRLGARLRTPERRLGGWQARGGVSSAPRSAPKWRRLPFPPARS